MDSKSDQHRWRKRGIFSSFHSRERASNFLDDEAECLSNRADSSRGRSRFARNRQRETEKHPIKHLSRRHKCFFVDGISRKVTYRSSENHGDDSRLAIISHEEYPGGTHVYGWFFSRHCSREISSYRPLIEPSLFPNYEKREADCSRY